MDENALLLDALRGRVDELYFAWSPAVLGAALRVGRSRSPRRVSKFSHWEEWIAGRRAVKIVRVREKCVTCKTDTNCLVTQRGCNTAGSFDLSDLAQTSEHQHKQFELHCKQLTAS